MFGLRSLQSREALNGLIKASVSSSSPSSTSEPVRCFSTMMLESDLWKDRKKPYRYPYERIPWNYMFGFFWDPRTKSKFNENSKVIQIDGNVKAGKQDFGKQLAELLGMKYFGPPDLDYVYINDYGFDYRTLNHKLPEHLRVCDLEMWHEDPGRESNIHMQNFMFTRRLDIYIDALAHIFNTGQGVVIDRSFISEQVFVAAMQKMGWLPLGFTREDGAEFYDWRYRYNFIRKLVKRNLPLPHLTLYLDVPVDECMKRIKDNKDPIERNSKALTPQFLTHIEDWYNSRVLEDMAESGWVLRFDNTKPMGRTEVLDAIDDIRKLDFERDPHDTRFQSWDPMNHIDWWTSTRRKVTGRKSQFIARHLGQPEFDIAGYGDRYTQAELTLRNMLYENHVQGQTHRKNFNLEFAPWWKVMLGYEDYRNSEKTKIYFNFL